MFEYLPMLFAIVIVFCVYQFARIQERLQQTESKLDALLKHFGVEWGKFSAPSDHVKELAKDPKTRIKAIKAYREQTGLSLKEAKDVIENLVK